MTEPYYQDESVTLYLGDCREVAAWLDADVLVTDPPYGMAYTGFGGRGYRDDAAKHQGVAGDNSTEIRDAALALWGDRPALVFGTWRAVRPSGVKALLVWHKTGAGGMGDLALPWLPSHEEVYVMGSGFTGKRSESVLRVSAINSQASSRPDHPTPKPVALMALLVEKTLGVVADPFAGSGSTLVAAKQLGRKAVGVELEERYCEIIAKRLAQGVLNFGDAS